MGKKPLSNETGDTEKPALSLRIPFLSYITELVFATVVFIVFLLVTWGLHCLGNTLGIAWIRFSWRIFEMLVISFGTLLCVLFFLKASAKFSQKLIRHLQKPSKQTDVIPSRLQPRDIAKSFVEPLHKQHLGWYVCSAFIIVAFLYVGISFADIIRDDCDDASILACEMICETGPDFLEPVDKHLIMLKNYTTYIENKYFAILLRIFSKYKPKEIFADANEILVNAKGTQEEFANEIWRAGEEIMLFRLKAPKLLPRGIALHEYRKAPEWLLNDIENALKESKTALTLFDEKQTMENAVNLCMANKKTMLLMFLARKSNQNQLSDDFQGIVETCRKSKIAVAKRIKEEDDPRKEFLLIISDSEQRRFDILDEIKKRNMQAAIERMWDAIEIAYSRRSKLLELCAKIRSAGNYSDEIGS